MLDTPIKNYWKTFEVLLIILLTVSPLIPRTLSIALIALIALVSIVDLLRKNVNITIDRSLIIVLLFFGLAMLWDIRNTVNGQPYSLVNFLCPVYFICGFLIAKRYKKSEFYDIFEKIIFVCALLSFVGMSVYFIKPSLIYSFPQYTYYGKTHHTILIFNYLFSGDWMAVRNTGIAWEPGVFQIILNLAFQISIQKHTGKKLFFRTCVYGLAVVLTRSTMGYAVLAINIFCLLKKHKKYIPFAVAVGLLGSAFIIPEFVYQIQNKLFGSSAFNARFDPLINAIKYAWDQPLGIGSTGYDMIYESQGLGSYDCYTQILLRFGYPVLIYVIGRFIRIWKRDNIYMSLILIVSFMSEPIWGSILTTVIYYLDDEIKTEVTGRIEQRIIQKQ